MHKTRQRGRFPLSNALPSQPKKVAFLGKFFKKKHVASDDNPT